MSNLHDKASSLGESGKLEQAWNITAGLLSENPLDVRALVTASYLMRRMGAAPAAYHFALTATRESPKEDAAWLNLGAAAAEMWLVDEAERAYQTALRYAHIQRHKLIIWLNLSALYLDNGRFDLAEEFTRKILSVDPNYRNAQANLGFCQLARGEWAKGWAGYHHTIGSDWRPKVQYRDELEWDGSPGKTVAIYSDQGLGDEISFASILPDAAAISAKLILDCDERLKGLFQRSFPNVKVYGTRRAKAGQWAPADCQIDASLPLGQIGEYFRTSADSFPGTPYLVPCPERVKMWKGLFASKGKLTVGIAWTGGIPKTNSRNRRIALEDFLPLFKSVDAHFVSLQYKDADEQIRAFKAKHPVDLEQYPWGTLTQDYDDTAALIASLDYVICIQTAVAHTAGALGIPVAVLIPTATTWRYGDTGDSIPWYACLRVIRQKKSGHWKSEIERAASILSADLERLPGRAGAPARNDELRHGLDRLRPAGQRDRQSNGHHPPA